MQGPRSCCQSGAARRGSLVSAGETADAGFRGKAPNVDATGHAVAAHPTGARLGEVAGTGPGSSSWCRARKPDAAGIGGQGSLIVDATGHAVAAYPNRAGLVRCREAERLSARVQGRESSCRGMQRGPRHLAKFRRHSAGEWWHHSQLANRLLSEIAHTLWLTTCRIRVEKNRSQHSESDSNCRMPEKHGGGG